MLSSLNQHVKVVKMLNCLPQLDIRSGDPDYPAAQCLQLYITSTHSSPATPNMLTFYILDHDTHL